MIKTLLPAKANAGLDFVPSHPRATEALAWMGFEARSAILEVLDAAIADTSAQVRAVVYDLNDPEIVDRLERLGKRLRIIIDDADAHGQKNAAESTAARRLDTTAAFVKRQHMGKLQHDKMLVVEGNKEKACVCGSTNLSWRGFYVQNNNAIILRGARAARLFMEAYDNYEANDGVAGFSATGSALWNDLKLKGIKAQIGFSPRSATNAVLKDIADDIAQHTTSSLFFSLAFLYQTPGPIRDAIRQVRKDARVSLRHFRPRGGRTVEGRRRRRCGRRRAAETERQGQRDPARGAGEERAATVQNRTRRRQRHPHAPQVRGHRFRQAERPCVHGLVQLLAGGRRHERGKPAADPQPPHRRVLHDRGDPFVRPLPLPGGPGGSEGEEENAATGKAARHPGEHPWWSEDTTSPRKILDRELFA